MLWKLLGHVCFCGLAGNYSVSSGTGLASLKLMVDLILKASRLLS